MIEKRFTHRKWYNERQLFDGEEPFAIVDIYIQSDKICDKLNELADENEQLKQQVTHLTMYKNLFREFQKQLDGVKKKSDLDHKDFEDLIELTKGHVFDDEHGWIWLPVNDR